MKKRITLLLCFFCFYGFSQELKLKQRQASALSGSQFTLKIADTTLSLSQRENLVFEEIRKGNVPNFYRKLSTIIINKNIDGTNYKLAVSVLPDYLVIGSDDDFIYMPCSPMLAQRIANLTQCLLPTKTLVDEIYKQAQIKLTPQPIAPSKLMTSVIVFDAHNQMVQKQLKAQKTKHLASYLTAGHKKDVILSNKAFGQNTARVVIYGWHKTDGKAIQPVYNKHDNTWVDYSHGIRLVSQKAVINGKRIKLSKLLKDPKLHQLISDEGVLNQIKYPIVYP